jgi:hypothetical protein
MPYEFSFQLMPESINAIDLNDTKRGAFLAKYATALNEAGLADVLWLAVVPEPALRGSLEFT